MVASAGWAPAAVPPVRLLVELAVPADGVVAAAVADRLSPSIGVPAVAAVVEPAEPADREET